MKSQRSRYALAVTTLLSVLAFPVPSASDDADLSDDRIERLLELLVERGAIDAKDAEGIVARNRAYEDQRGWLERIEFYGDFRGRYEGFWFERDPFGNDPADQHRLRYRFRLGTDVELHDRISLGFRLASGDNAKTHNITLGRGDDFDPDSITIDLAFLRFRPFGSQPSLPATERFDVVFGKMNNLFRSKRGQDMILWDGDLTPEGIALQWDPSLCDCVDLSLEAAYYVLDENANGTDPDLFAIQLEASGAPADALTAGAALSWYGYRSLDQAFLDRGSFAITQPLSAGNVPRLPGTTGGLTRDRSVDIGDLRVWAKFAGIENLPVLVYGNVAHNFSAVDTVGFGAGKEDLAWSAGLEVGDKKKYALLGVAYFWVEANSVPANFTDSDLFDGRTNGKGWFLYGSRELFANVDLGLELFISEALKDRILGATGYPPPSPLPDPWVDAVRLRDRIRFRTDVKVRF